ncbi:peptide chain release factor N(5)-glutamine methyltransferase [uncultured Vibrio sp.]|uniref:peptide chain release factor N(5)-glutamine methyltransferase n=1 Tax=uncultured Vibrio sp. TaxID=114054 RepID=UPI00092118EE|nr:peptide chain release factor N(5)-glutamine methyltransferase [uncultured Vibrio sp.]OIQ25541.1 MAG: protein-(glutamine-N5) methyltransferase, release factor-specific [Vibrio sp. MedPE-SWchi]
MSTVEQTLKSATSALLHSGSDSPALDAGVLLCHSLDKPRSFLLTWPDKELTKSELSAFQQLLQRRIGGEPIAYIVGEREFWSLSLKVSPTTLIPRPDTERLVEVALDKSAGQSGPILDLGTGTGAIALALASEMPERQVVGIDLKQEAQSLATDNAKSLNIQNARFLSGSWFSPLEDGTKFALIVSNPPYIDEKDPHLSLGDVRFEPMSALVAKENGLADIRYITQTAVHYLEEDAWLMFEHGFEQGELVRGILAESGYQSIETVKDYGNNDRVTFGQWKNNK